MLTIRKTGSRVGVASRVRVASRVIAGSRVRSRVRAVCIPGGCRGGSICVATIVVAVVVVVVGVLGVF